jgi:uncharacterized membrane protein YeaQ/YmgE (transglycosylase-associated protein family)
MLLIPKRKARLGMFYSIWLLAAALAGWAAGKIAGEDGFGTLADILLGRALSWFVGLGEHRYFP